MVVDKTIRNEAVKAISDHLAEEGPRNWHLVRKRFPQVPDATWWRWVRGVREAPIGPARTQSIRTAVGRAKERLNEAESRLIEEGAAELPAATSMPESVACLPTAPSPAFLATGGSKAVQSLNLLAMFHQLVADAEMLRAYSLSEGGKIRNPATFDKSIERRLRLIGQALEVTQQVWDLETMQRFYDIIVAEVTAEAPDTARRIMVRLDRLSERYGMSFSTRL